MSTINEIYALYDTLYTLGLFETLCFIATDDNNWWYIKYDALMHSIIPPSTRSDALINCWQI